MVTASVGMSEYFYQIQAKEERRVQENTVRNSACNV